MSRTVGGVKLFADFKISPTRQQLWNLDPEVDQTKNQSVNVSVAFGIIAKWLQDFGSAAFSETTAFASSTHQHALDGTDLTGTLPVSKISGLGTAATVNTESTLTNGSNLPTGAAITTFINNQISALGNILTFKGVVSNVSSLPVTGNEIGDVYFVGDDTVGTDDFEEYVWANVSKTSTPAYDWERFGTIGTNVDLSDYLTDIGFSQDTTTAELKLKATKTPNKGQAVDVAEFSLAHASTTRYGVTMLSSSTSSTSTDLAATPYAVKLAYDQAKIYNSTPVSLSGTGNAVTGLSVVSGQLIATKGLTFPSSKPDLSDLGAICDGDTDIIINCVPDNNT